MKKIEIFILILIALIIPLYVLWGNLFPVFDYYMKKSNNHGIAIKKKDFNGDFFLLNPYYKDYPFSRVDLKVDFNKNPINPVSISIYENYESLAFPQKGEIDNVEEFKKYLYFENNSGLPNGSLFSNGESVFFVSRGEYRPILGSEIFEKLGFDWEVVIPQETAIFSSLKEEGEKVVFDSTHPDGTILEINDDFFLVWEENLIKIKNKDILREAWNDFFVVSADNLEELDSCVLQKQRGECVFDVSDSSSFNLPFIFKVNKKQDLNVVDAQTKFRVSTKVGDIKKSFLILLSHIKQDLVGRYGGYLF